MPAVQFTLTDEEREFFRDYARLKGMSASALAKMALFQYEARHPLRGVSLPQVPLSPQDGAAAQT